MTAQDWAALIGALVPLAVAATAWLKARTTSARVTELQGQVQTHIAAQHPAPPDATAHDWPPPGN